MNGVLSYLWTNRLTVAAALLAAFTAANAVVPIIDPTTLTTLTAIAAALGIHVAAGAGVSARAAHDRLDGAKRW